MVTSPMTSRDPMTS